MSWSSNELVHAYFTHNGNELDEWEGVNGLNNFTLEVTGSHELCLVAYDSTEGQYNENIFKQCRLYVLDESVYQTNILAPWNGSLTTDDNVMSVITRGPDQNIWWQIIGEDERFLITPGSTYVQLDFSLKEGLNQYLIEIEALDTTDTYELEITRDTIAPVLTFNQVSIRNSTLDSLKVIEGECESGTYVMIWSIIDTHEFICDSSGAFSIEISVRETTGSHLIQGISTDAVNNRNSYSVEVINQDWIDWAIDDAQNQGPMLWYFLASIAGILMLLSMTVLLRKSFRGRKEKISASTQSIEDSLEEINELLRTSPSENNPIDWNTVNEDLPEVEELKAWKENNRSIYTISSDNDDDLIDLD